MKRSRTKLNELIDKLIESPLRTEPGNDGATVTQVYLNQLKEIVGELIELSHEGDYKGRHGIHYDIRSYSTHENAYIDAAILRLSEDATPEQQERALERATDNVEAALRVVKDLARGFRYRREDAEIEAKKSTANP